MMFTQTNNVQTRPAEPVTLDIQPLIEPAIEPATTDFMIEPCVIFPENDEIQALYKQLDEIFGTPDFNLNEAEQKQVDALYEKVNAFFAPNENGEWVELTEAQEKEVAALYDQIDDIYGIVNYDDLSPEQQQQVDNIYAELDKLWADQINILPVEPIDEEAQALYDRLDDIFGTYKQELTEEEQTQVDELNSQIEEMLSPDENGNWPELTEEQHEVLNGLYKQIDKVYGVVSYDDLSEDLQEEVDGIYAQLDAIYLKDVGLDDGMVSIMPVPAFDDEVAITTFPAFDANGESVMPFELIDKSFVKQATGEEVSIMPLPAFDEEVSIMPVIEPGDGLVSILPVFDEKTQALFDELDEIFGTPDFDLTEDERAQVDELNKQVDELLGPDENGEWPELTEQQETELDGLFKQIDKIYGVVSYEDLTEEQQQRVDEIHAELNPEPMIAIEPVDKSFIDVTLIDALPIDLDKADFSDLAAVSPINDQAVEGDNWTDFGMFEFVDNAGGQEVTTGNQVLELTGLADFSFDFDFSGL